MEELSESAPELCKVNYLIFPCSFIYTHKNRMRNYKYGTHLYFPQYVTIAHIKTYRDPQRTIEITKPDVIITVYVSIRTNWDRHNVKVLGGTKTRRQKRK